jgi:hypothetical protein
MDRDNRTSTIELVLKDGGFMVMRMG